MPYSEQELEEIGRDPVRLRAWWWRVGTNQQRMALTNRRRSRALASINHVVTDYQDSYEDGADMVRWAGVNERMSTFILGNIDACVRGSLEPAYCTCRASTPGPT